MTSEPQAVPEFRAKLPGGAQIYLSYINLFTFIKFCNDPPLQTIQTSQPEVEIIFAHQSGWLDDHAISTAIAVNAPAHTVVETCRVYPHHRDEVIECSHQRAVFPVCPEIRKRGLIYDEVCTQVGQYPSSFRLPPKVDAYRQAYSAEVGIENLVGIVIRDNPEELTLPVTNIGFSLPPDDVAAPIEKGSTVEPLGPHLFYQTCN